MSIASIQTNPQIKPSSSTDDLRIFISTNSTDTAGMPLNEFYERIQPLIESHQCQPLLIDVIRNFVRKMNFADLNEALDGGDISEEEFEKELENNADKYAISLRNLRKGDNILLYINLVNKISHNLRNFSISEVAEMFSIKESEFLDQVNLLNK